MKNKSAANSLKSFLSFFPENTNQKKRKPSEYSTQTEGLNDFLRSVIQQNYLSYACPLEPRTFTIL